MFEMLKTILKDNWEWRHQIPKLAKIELMKTVRGAVMGWVWLFAKPAIYILCFWFALSVGLRAGTTTGDYPYIVWLAAGIIPWFFMSVMLTTGANVYNRYSFLVNRVKFPLSVISHFYILAQLFINVCLMAIFILIACVCGFQLSVYALQVPVLIFIMFLLAFFWSTLTSPLSALSKDFHELLKALSTPMFWLSGVIFKVSSIHIGWVRTLLAFNPVTFFVQAFRAALCDRIWIWEEPKLFLPFLAIFFVIVILALWSQKRWYKEIADVL